MMDISVVILTYERFHTLERTFQSIRKFLDETDFTYEIIIADDNSSDACKRKILSLPADKHVLSDVNRGLGANANQAQKISAGRYVIYLQDDWLCNLTKFIFEKVILIMEDNPSIGVINFMKQDIAPQKVNVLHGIDLRIFDNIVNLDGKPSEYPYSDNPHIKSRSFISNVGPYIEDIDMRNVEKEFCLRVSSQEKYFIADISKSYFEHIGEEYSFNPGYKRDKFKKKLLANILTRYPLLLLLAIKNKLK